MDLRAPPSTQRPPPPSLVFTTTPTPAVTNLFTDGLLTIFRYLSFNELMVAAVCTCHYWYSTALKEKGRQVEFDCHSVNLDSECLLQSPFQYHITSLANASIRDLRAIQPGQLPRVEQLYCWFDGSSGSHPVGLAAHSSSSPGWLTLPLTRVQIHITLECIAIDVCQSFLNDLSTSSGAAASRLTTLEIWNRHEDAKIDLTPCGSLPLKKFTLVEFGLCDFEPYLKFFTACGTTLLTLELDIRLSLSDVNVYQLLVALPKLDQLILGVLDFCGGDLHDSWMSFQYLPRVTIIKIFTCDSSDHFLRNLIQAAKRLEILEMRFLYGRIVDGVQSRFEEIVSQMKQLKRIKIGNHDWGNFDFLPQPRLVGIETNPGPDSTSSDHFITSLSPSRPVLESLSFKSTPTAAAASNLFADGLLTIFQYLSFKELMVAGVCTCQYWYATALKEKGREVEFWCGCDPPHDIACLLKSPFQYHITSIRDASTHDLRAIQPGQLPRVKQLYWFFEDSGGNGSAGSTHPAASPSWLLTLPLTALVMRIVRNCDVNLYQSFINYLSTNSASRLTELVICNEQEYVELDLTPCASWPLTNLALHDLERERYSLNQTFFSGCLNLTSLELEVYCRPLLREEMEIILTTLLRLDQINLLSELDIDDYYDHRTDSLRSLPRVTIIHRFTCLSFDEFLSHISQAERLEILEIHFFKFRKPREQDVDEPKQYLNELRSQFEQTVTQMKQLKRITMFSQRWGHFNFPPQPRLVGIETNPGPFDQTPNDIIPSATTGSAPDLKLVPLKWNGKSPRIEFAWSTRSESYHLSLESSRLFLVDSHQPTRPCRLVTKLCSTELQTVLSFLPIKQLCMALSTCKSIHREITPNHSLVWRRFKSVTTSDLYERVHKSGWHYGTRWVIDQEGIAPAIPSSSQFFKPKIHDWTNSTLLRRHVPVCLDYGSNYIDRDTIELMIDIPPFGAIIGLTRHDSVSISLVECEKLIELLNRSRVTSFEVELDWLNDIALTKLFTDLSHLQSIRIHLPYDDNSIQLTPTIFQLPTQLTDVTLIHRRWNDPERMIGLSHLPHLRTFTLEAKESYGNDDTQLFLAQYGSLPKIFGLTNLHTLIFKNIDLSLSVSEDELIKFFLQLTRLICLKISDNYSHQYLITTLIHVGEVGGLLTLDAVHLERADCSEINLFFVTNDFFLRHPPLSTTTQPRQLIHPNVFSILPGVHWYLDFEEPTDSEMQSIVANIFQPYDHHIHLVFGSKDIPAKRLVGIETNPGPVVTTTTTTPSPTAQTLFVDGVLSIFSYLSLSQLLPALHSCHYWYKCGLKERCRHMELCLEDPSSPTHLAQFRRLLNLINSPLRFHITNINCMNICHQLAIKELNLPNLHVCKFLFIETFPELMTQFHAWNEMRTNTLTNPIEFLSAFRLPGSLRTLKIDFLNISCHTSIDFCQSLINSIKDSSINEFELWNEPEDHHYDLSPIGQVTQLTALRLYICTPLNDQDQRMLASLALNELSISVNSSPNWTILHPSSPLMLSVRRWRWFDNSVTGSQNHLFHLSHHSPHSITHVDHWLVTGNDQTIIDFTLFTQLTYLTLRMQRLVGLFEGSADKYTTILSRCRSITHLNLKSDIFTDDQLCRILQALKNTLQTLELWGLRLMIHHAFGYLPPITKVNTLQLYRFELFLTTLAKSNRSEKLTVDTVEFIDRYYTFPFDDVEFQSICHRRLSNSMQTGFTLELKRVNSLANQRFMLVYINSITPIPPHTTLDQSMKDVPAKRLVGIETNPGPVVTVTSPLTTTSLTMIGTTVSSPFSDLSRLPKDWLIHITTFLTLHELINILGVTCHSMLSLTQSVPCRDEIRHLRECLQDESYSYMGEMKTRGILKPFLKSPHRRHVTILECKLLSIMESRDSYREYDLGQALQHLTHLKVLRNFPIVCGSEDVSPSFGSFHQLDTVHLKFIYDNTIVSEDFAFNWSIVHDVLLSLSHLTNLTNLTLAFTVPPTDVDEEFHYHPPVDILDLLPPTLTNLHLKCGGIREFILATRTFQIIRSLPHLIQFSTDGPNLSESELELLTTPTGACLPLQRLGRGTIYQLTQSKFDYLIRLKSLTTIGLDFHRASRSLLDDFTGIRELRSLTDLELSLSTRMGVESLLAGLSACSSTLTSLFIRDGSFTSLQFKSIMTSCLKNIQRLRLDQCENPEFNSLDFLLVDHPQEYQLQRIIVQAQFKSSLVTFEEFIGWTKLISIHLEVITNDLPNLAHGLAQLTPGSSTFRSDLYPNLQSFDCVTD